MAEAETDSVMDISRSSSSSSDDEAPLKSLKAMLEKVDKAHVSGFQSAIPNSLRPNPTLSTSMSWNDQLTVDKKWKVEEELAQKMSQIDGPSRIVPIAKWLFTILLCTAITSLFVATKISFIYLSFGLNMTASAQKPGSQDIRHTSQFLIIFLVIEIPYFLMFLRAIWFGLLTKNNLWPSRSAIVCCLVNGILEPLGIVIMAIKVLPDISLHLGALILSCVIALSIIVETLKFIRLPGRIPVNIAMITSCVLVLVGMGLTIYMIYNEVQDSTNHISDIVHAVVGVVCLNIAWLPRLLRHTNHIPNDLYEIDGGQINASASYGHTRYGETYRSTLSHATTLDNSTRLTQPFWRRELAYRIDNAATWKASFIIYGIKTVAAFIFSIIFFYVDSPFLDENFSKESHNAFISAWNFSAVKIDDPTWMAFGVNLLGALVCYVMAFIAAHTNMQRGCLAIPFILSLPLTVSLTSVNSLCDTFIDSEAACYHDSNDWYFILGATVCLTIGQTLAFGRYAFRKEQVYLLKEEKDESEMQQLLESLAKVNAAQVEGETLFESHIIFDGGVKLRKLSEFPLTLISLLENALGILPSACTKIVTPYGMKLSWGLPTSRGKMQMNFNIHLKDNTLVKNKKRWSQVMYMSYVLDFLADTASPDEERYILTTDADVQFTPESVEALLDLMCRDQTVGAVCARTHPMGSGPLVWYQVFEYAVGHWFQKAAEHVLGSVLCAPGCFSVYRCRALRDILPKYCKKVESSFDFLTKDMGEDRWLCSLMVQSGWRIEYCAASENSTNCPAEFEEFFKQRRRWIASTLANLMLIIKEWKYIALFNQRVSVVFLLYQVLLLFSTLIAPSTVILVVSGGLVYAWGINSIVAVLLQVIACVIYAIVCIVASPKTQILMAKIYTFVYAVIMCAVAVGTAEQVVDDLSGHSNTVVLGLGNETLQTTLKPNTQDISIDLPLSVSTLYFAFLITIFLLAGLLHPREIGCLFHGFCYLLCIPTAYLVLMIYSICNLTDSSWGTREAETVTASVKQISWTDTYKKIFFSIFFCCAPKQASNGVDTETQTTASSIFRRLSSSTMMEAQSSPDVDTGVLRTGIGDNVGGTEWQWQSAYLQERIDTEELPISVDEWLPPDFRSKYAEIFKRHGFDSTLFIKGLTETDLNRMGVTKRGHIQFLMAAISTLPAYEIEYKVPTNVKEWLQEIGLVQYSSNFQRNHIRTPKEMEILKRFDRSEIEKELGITKEGHVKRLINAIRMLRDPSESQQRAVRMRQAIDETPVHYLKDSNVIEYEFWTMLREKCLEPDLKAFGIDAEVKVNLVELRNNWLLVMAVANTLWLILISTLALKADLTVLGANPLGLVFLILFGLLFIVQFLAMLVHRLSTLSHYVARAPYTFGRPFQSSWSFKDKDSNDIEDEAAARIIRQVKQAAVGALKNVGTKSKKVTVGTNEAMPKPTTEHTPLLNNDGQTNKE